MVRHTVNHSLDVHEACQLVERAFTHYEERYPAYQPSMSWVEPGRAEIRFNAKGFKLTARVEIQPGRAVVEMDVPLLLRPFQGIARQVIDREVSRWLARS